MLLDFILSTLTPYVIVFVYCIFAPKFSAARYLSDCLKAGTPVILKAATMAEAWISIFTLPSLLRRPLHFKKV